MKRTVIPPIVDVISDYLREQETSPCCGAVLSESGLDVQCLKCRRVYSRLDPNQTTRRAFEK